MNLRVIPTAQSYGTPFDVEGLKAICRPTDVYRRLMGADPETACIDSDEDFDRHVIACIVSVAASEPGALTERLGLTLEDLEALRANYFGDCDLELQDDDGAANAAGVEESQLVRDILLEHLSSQDQQGRLLAAMIARRALEPNHLWEDLGLRNRGELTRLMERRFASLAARNDKNMRWKRFIYRLMCENDGFVMCATPVCTNCADYLTCFGEETGTSRLSSGLSQGDPPSV
ncbi:nitrogen fixation protein NifQ [Methylocystis sp. B8]|uniref:nitrogen fixation protein NifQ n=1 Tax=Methylocystis sp. B8 TaxID=544938 RepID=UPI001FEE52AA|nr:nitrogen fixation protein NifQ [Methylocystis sp. B8]